MVMEYRGARPETDAFVTNLINTNSSTAAALRAAYAPLGAEPTLLNLRRLQSVGYGLNQGVPFTQFSPGTYQGGTSRIWVGIAEDVFDALPVYDNGIADTAGPSTMTVAASIERADGTILPLFFNGHATATVAPGAQAIPDNPAPVNAAAADGGFWVRTYVNVPSSSGDKYPANYDPTNAPAGTGCNYSATGGVNLTASGSVTGTTGQFFYAPAVILGTRKTRRVPLWGLVGDSIMAGKGDTPAMRGFGALAAATQAASVVLVAVFGETASAVSAPAAYLRRLTFLSGCTHALCDYGHNDFGASNRTLAQVQADILAIWTKLNNRGMAVYQCTLLPKTTSTDNWATTGSQTPNVSESNRVAFNTWLRAGAPIDPGSLAAVAVGTGGALLAGATTHPLSGIVETADTCETARNSGLWKVNGSANYATTDGTHPTTAFHTAMAAAIPTLTLPSIPRR